MTADVIQLQRYVTSVSEGASATCEEQDVSKHGLNAFVL